LDIELVQNIYSILKITYRTSHKIKSTLSLLIANNKLVVNINMQNRYTKKSVTSIIWAYTDCINSQESKIDKIKSTDHKTLIINFKVRVNSTSNMTTPVMEGIKLALKNYLQRDV
jgi:hypothetical protein